MKIVNRLVLLNGLLLAIILTACQPAKPAVLPTVGATISSGQSQPNTYPAPAQPAAQSAANTPYPEPPAGTQPTTINWSDAKSLIINAQIAKVIQAKSLEVTLYTKDARLFKTTEPALDDVLKVIEQCGTDCKVIKVVNQ